MTTEGTGPGDTDGAAGTPLRVAQWATGNIGTRSLRHVIEHPGMELVGLRVYGADKVGRDAGELAGLDPCGVLANDDVDAIVATRPDCVLYMPRMPEVDVLVRLLGEGIDVVSTSGLFHHPPSMDPELRATIEDACERGGSTIHATGSSPGFITEAIPLVLSSIQREIRAITIDEFANMESRNSPEMIFDLMGFGQPMGEPHPGRLHHLGMSFGPSLRLVADAMSVPLDDVVVSGANAAATRTVEIAAGTVEAGTVAGMRTTVSGMRDGRELLRFRANWFVTPDLDADWDLLDTGWRVEIDGDAPLRVDMPFPVPPERMAETTPGYTANRAVNAVPYVCAAGPGIKTTLDLPRIVPTLA